MKKCRPPKAPCTLVFYRIYLTRKVTSDKRVYSKTLHGSTIASCEVKKGQVNEDNAPNEKNRS